MSSRALRTHLGQWFLTLILLALATSIATATSPGMQDPMREARTGLPLMPGLLPSAYQAFPFTQLDRDPTEGARHGFVQTTGGRFGFEALGTTLRSLVPFQLGRTYDAGITGMIPGAPTQEPPINYDFGPNWILKPTASLIPTSPTHSSC